MQVSRTAKRGLAQMDRQSQSLRVGVARRLPRIMLALFGAGAFLFGSSAHDAWNKDFADWTTTDAQEIMANSPWAKQRPMPVSQRPGVVYVDPAVNASSPSAELGNSSNTTTGPNGSSAAVAGTSGGNRSGPLSGVRTPSMASGPVGAPSAEPPLKVIWASALPVRLAVLKLRSGATPPNDEQLANTQKDWPNYVIAVVGLPAPEAGSDPKALAKTAFLSTHNAAPLMATDSDYRRIGDSDVYFFRFKKSALPLTEASQQVEFKFTKGQLSLSQKFQLAAMNFHGHLAL